MSRQETVGSAESDTRIRRSLAEQRAKLKADITTLAPAAVARLVVFPGIAGLLGLILNAWHSDKTGELTWQATVPILCAGLSYLLVIVAQTISR